LRVSDEAERILGVAAQRFGSDELVVAVYKRAEQYSPGTKPDAAVESALRDVKASFRQGGKTVFLYHVGRARHTLEDYAKK
jgi:hypothetical protein